MARVRLGIILIVLSWLPFAQLLLYIAHTNGKLSSESSSNEFRLVIWGIQVIIGLIGLWLVGKLAIQIAKEAGWKQTPSRVWQLFLHGQKP